MIQKKYLKSKDVYRTTFRLDKQDANGAQSVKVLGEFNDWGNQDAIEMEQLKNGDFKAVADLPKGQYEFKYLVDQDNWINEPEADQYVPDTFGGENSVVVLD